MKVCVLGCGPAGLMAAQGVLAVDPSADVVILSKKIRSTIGGAQYLHIPVPGITQPAADGFVWFSKPGFESNYALRVYGDANAKTSWGQFGEGYQPVWNMREAYDRLWDLYEHVIHEAEVDISRIDMITQHNDLVISSIPLKSICNDEDHEFTWQDVWIDKMSYVSGMTILYNGYPITDNHPHGQPYRQSELFGHRSSEYSHEHVGTHIRKPLSTDCNCWPNIKRVGRYGKWEKHQLISTAYEDAKEMTRALLSV